MLSFAVAGSSATDRSAHRWPSFHKPFHLGRFRHAAFTCTFRFVGIGVVTVIFRSVEVEIQWLDRRYEIDTLFLGGGTPSHLPPAEFERLFEIVSRRFDFAADAEVTAECNPSDVSPDRVDLFSRCGINRVSLGVQSFDDRKLKVLERDHTADVVRKAVGEIRSRIDNISMDLIFAAPEETMVDWRNDLESAIALKPSHLSTYELTFEKGTQFWNRLSKGALRQSDEDLCAAMYEHTIDRTADAGMSQYEVSSFASQGLRCRHNLGYWSGDPYFAFGPGASRFVDGIRETNHGSTMHYLKKIEQNESPVADREQLEGRQAAAERLAVGLRQNAGVERAPFLQRTGFSVDDVLGNFRTTLLDNDLASDDGAVIRLTRAGMMVCDRVSVEILDGL